MNKGYRLWQHKSSEVAEGYLTHSQRNLLHLLEGKLAHRPIVNNQKTQVKTTKLLLLQLQVNYYLCYISYYLFLSFSMGFFVVLNLLNIVKFCVYLIGHSSFNWLLKGTLDLIQSEQLYFGTKNNTLFWKTNSPQWFCFCR